MGPNEHLYHIRGDTSPYVVSEDIEVLLREWAAEAGFTLPSGAFFAALRGKMIGKLNEFFREVQFIPVEKVKKDLYSLIDPGTTIISLDRIYSEKGGFILEATRIPTSIHEEHSELGSRNQTSLKDQIANLSAKLCGTPVTLIDDVIYSGKTHATIVERLRDAGIPVKAVVAGISIGDGEKILHEKFPELAIQSVYHYESVIDEICERDFYAGVPYSGRLLGEYSMEDGEYKPYYPERGALYFETFGNSKDWASIPEEATEEWDRFCLARSIELWDEVERVSGKQVTCFDVPRLPHLILPLHESFTGALRRYLHHVHR